MHKLSRLICFPTLILCLAGCASGQKRTQLEECVEANNQANCGSSVYTILSDGDDNRGWQPKIGYFEFNEAGLPYDAALHAALLSKIEQQAALSEQAERPLLLIVFIHGWLHNAANDDSNVVSFKELLQQVQADEDISEVGSRRNVVGLYIGWQAKSSSSDLVNLLSYKRKKELGIETGRASVTRLLEQLYDIRQKNERNRMVSVGHSFGGGLLFSATREQLIGAAMSETGTQRKAYSDLVVLVNPAMAPRQNPPVKGKFQVSAASPSLTFSRWNISRILRPSETSSSSVSGFHWLRVVPKKSPP